MNEKTLQSQVMEREGAEGLMDVLIQHPKVREAIKEAVRESWTQDEIQKSLQVLKFKGEIR